MSPPARSTRDQCETVLQTQGVCPNAAAATDQRGIRRCNECAFHVIADDGEVAWDPGEEWWIVDEATFTTKAQFEILGELLDAKTT